MSVPTGQSKRRRIHGKSATGGVGQKLIELEVLSISGECMLSLNVADSMLGRELWKNILDKLPFKPGRQLVLSHNTSKLVLHKSLQQQGFGSEWEQVSATYVPVNLLAALRFAHGFNVEDEEFSLDGIAEMTEVSDNMPALLHNLPKSLHTLTFAPGFNRELRHVRLPAGLQSLTLGQTFNQNLDNVTWPAGLQNLTFGFCFNQNLDKVTWPAGLQSLTFGVLFNQNLDNVTWPAGLQNLTFGQRFNQNLDNMTWPAGLQCLTFGGGFNQNLDNMTWPAGLQSLTLSAKAKQKLDKVAWPAGLQSLTLGGGFNSNLDSVSWPERLRRLTLGQNFNQSLDNVTWPASLQCLTLGQKFNRSLDKVTWPAGLQSLTFGVLFNQNLDNVTWPAGLQSLTFDERFDQSLDNVTWPAGLQSLAFGFYFNQSLDNVTWPAGLQCLTFGFYFNQNLDKVTWPAGLQSLTFGVLFNQNLDNVTWPAGLQNLTFGQRFNQNLDNMTWPAGLQSLTLGGGFNQNLDNMTWPEGLQSLTLGEDDQSLDKVTWPEGLKYLTFVSSSMGRRLLESNVVLPRSLHKLRIESMQLMCWREHSGDSIVWYSYVFLELFSLVGTGAEIEKTMGSEQRCVCFFCWGGGAYSCSCQPLHVHDFTHQDAHFDFNLPNFSVQAVEIHHLTFLRMLFFVLGIFFDFFSNRPFLRWGKTWPTNIHTGETTESQGVQVAQPQRRSPQNVAKSKGVPTQIPLLQVWNNSDFSRYMDGPKNLHVELGVWSNCMPGCLPEDGWRANVPLKSKNGSNERDDGSMWTLIMHEFLELENNHFSGNWHQKYP